MSIAMLVGLAVVAQGRLVTFDNTKARLDTNGAIMNAHDGPTQRFGGSSSPFYYHAMGYPAVAEPGGINGCANGKLYKHNNSVSVFSSPDLSSGSWKMESVVYPSKTSGFPTCTYFRSQVVFNKKTSKYLLWMNVAGCKKGVDSKAYAVGTSDKPAGPFTFQGFTQPTAASIGNHSGFIGDFALYVDDDGTAYNILTRGIAGPGNFRDMYIFALTDDYLNFDQAAGKSIGPLPGQHLVEAPAFFKRGKTYYAFLGGCTCMGLYGGGVNVLTAAAPLGPWSNVTATLDPGCPMWKQPSCGVVGPGTVCNPVSQAQQNYVITVPLADGTLAYVWTGDKWQQAPNKMFDQQPQTWIKLEFDGDTVLPLKYEDSFTLDVAV